MKRSDNSSDLSAKSKLDQSASPSLNETQVVKLETVSWKHERAEECTVSEDICGPVARKTSKGSHRSSKKKRVEMGVSDVSMVAQKDLELERKLSKKLKVKEGKLRGVDDGLNLILEGIPSAADLIGEREVPGADGLPKKRLKKSSLSKKHKLSKEGMEAESLDIVPESVEISNQLVASEVPDHVPSKKKHKKRKLSGQELEDDVEDDCIVKPVESCRMGVTSGVVPAEVPKAKEKYIAPHLRARAGNEPEEHTQLRRRVRGRDGRDFVLTSDFSLYVINCYSSDLFLQAFLTGFLNLMLSQSLENCH